MMTDPFEFTCKDCKDNVVSFGHAAANDPEEVCVTCQWLRSIEDPKERLKLREWLRRNDNAD